MAKILIIDDEADMRFALRMLLERSGHTVVEAGDGARFPFPLPAGCRADGKRKWVWTFHDASR